MINVTSNTLVIADLKIAAHRIWNNEFVKYGSKLLHANASSYSFLGGIESLGQLPLLSVTQTWKNRGSKRWFSELLKSNTIDTVIILGAVEQLLWLPYVHELYCQSIVVTFGDEVIIEMQSLVSRKDITGVVKLRKLRKGLQKTSLIVSSSEVEREIIQRYFLGDVGVNVVHTYPFLDKFEHNDRKKQILFAKNMVPNNNHHFVLDTIANIDQRIIEEYSFIFVDRNGWNKEYISFIQEKIDELEDHKIEFKTFSSDSVEYLELVRESEVSVFTGLGDGTPFEAILSLCANTPIIFPDTGFDEIFEKSIFYKPYHEDEFLKSIETICLNPDLIDTRNDELQKRWGIEEFLNLSLDD
ncbi:MAG: glycosyltransferase [Crocinitomicaceae bacterium]|nr:glycosyltransferase [Crocinitomicaceae bacterium]